jgi:hypothetical protein
MKSKNKFYLAVITTMLFFGILINVGATTMPKTQSNGDYELGYEIGDYFEYYCTEMDTTELNNVFGGDWATNLGGYFWFTNYNPPSGEGEKTRFEFVDINNDTTSWYFTMDGWDWTPKTSSYGTPAQDDQIYTLYKNVSAGTFNPTVWIIMLPVLDFISEIQYFPNFYGIGNTIFYNGTDVQDFQVAWVYDETTGIVKNFWIQNNVGTTIFEMWGFELKVQDFEHYNWIVTNFNQGQITAVFGSDWENDIEAYCWWALDAPIISGEKSMFYIDAVVDHSSVDDWYSFDVDGWNWKAKELLHGGVPDRDDVLYNLPMDPEGITFHYSLFMIPIPVIRYLELLTFSAGYSNDGNKVTRTTTDDQEYTVVWQYDEDLGVVDSFQIKNAAGTTIFHIILMEFKWDPGTAFEWEVTVVDDTRLEDVLGVDWESNIQTFFGTGCNEIGATMKFATEDINLEGNLWNIDYDIWLWTTSSYANTPDSSDTYGLYCNPEDGNWGSWMWIVPYLPDYYLAGRTYVGTTALDGLTVTQNATDVEDYQILYTYNAVVGAFDTVQLVNNESTVLFEYQLISVEPPPGGDGIPGFDTFFVISSAILMIGLISIIYVRKKIKI